MPTGVALVDVTPEPCRAAREDLIHDSLLLPAPLRSGWRRQLPLEIPVEDLSDLVSRSFAHLLEVDHLPAQRIQRTARRAHTLRSHVRVDRRRPE